MTATITIDDVRSCGERKWEVKAKPTKRNPPSFRRQLAKLGACKAAMKWVGNKTLATAWRECNNAGWMWWIIFWLGLAYTDIPDYSTTGLRKQFSARVIAKAMKERFK